MEFLESPVNSEKAVLLDQSQRRIDKLQHSHVQRIQGGPVKSYCANRESELINLSRHFSRY